MANLLNDTGLFKNKSVTFERKDGKIVFTSEYEDENQANIMMPILAAIRPIDDPKATTPPGSSH